MESHVVEGVGVVDEMELWVMVRKVEFRLYFMKNVVDMNYK